MGILDIGAPVSLAGKEWMTQYLRVHGLEIKDLKMQECNQVFRFGPSKQYSSTVMVELPMIVKRMDGKDDVLKVFAYLVEADVPFLCGKRTLEKWRSKVDTTNKVLETMIDGEKKNFRIIDTGSNHYGIEIENRSEKGEEILYGKGKEEELETYKAVKKVHEVNNHKSVDQLVAAYRKAGLMGPKTIKTIKEVVNNCNVCQKFGKSMVKPKIALAKAGSFNEIVTLDLKQFGSRYVLWCIDSFTRFVQGKLLCNKKADTIVPM